MTGQNFDVQKVAEETTIDTQSLKKTSLPFYKWKKIIICCIGILLLIVIISSFFIFHLSAKSEVTSSSNSPVPVSVLGPNKIIAKVGKEFIYQKDVDYELSQYPNIPGVDAKKVVLQKLINDSIALQAAATLHTGGSTPQGSEATGTQTESNSQNGNTPSLGTSPNTQTGSTNNTITPLPPINTQKITSDATVFNSPTKNYEKRLAVVEQIQNQYDQQQTGIQGSVISIWFYNTQPAAVGYDQGKAIALAKITKLHDAVKNGTSTIQQAAQQIQNDTSLAGLDPVYKENAIFDFSEAGNEQITFDPQFDAIIRGLKPGQISDVYLAKDTVITSGQKIDAVYMFAQVTTNNTHTTDTSFTDWIASQAKKYEVTYY